MFYTKKSYNIRHSTTQLTNIHSQAFVDRETFTTICEEFFCVFFCCDIFCQAKVYLFFFSLFFFGFHLVVKAKFVVFLVESVFYRNIFYMFVELLSNLT